MIPNHSLAGAKVASDIEASPPLWFRISWLLLFTVAVVLFLVVVGDRDYRSNISFAILIVVLLAIACSAYLYVRGWYETRKDAHATEREFTSVCQHALDAILILDNQAKCVDANPAAFALLGAPPPTLIGHSFTQFHEDRFCFDRQWHAFLEQGYHRGQFRLLRANRTRVIVHYTAAANYVPGRHVLILCDITERVEAQDSLRKSNERIQQISDNIHEIAWMMDAATKQILQVNRAYETITGRPLESIASNPSSYTELIHPADRVQVLLKLEDAVHSGHLDEEFRILRPDGEVRWVWVKASPVPNDGSVIRQLVGTAQDITAKKLADAKIAEHLAAAEAARDQADAARAEAEALRKATLALTQNLRMDAVLDTFLRCLREIVPYDSASVLLTEAEGRLFVAREAPPASENKLVVTLEPRENALLEQALQTKKSVHVHDTQEELGWHAIRGFASIRCWIGVPLITSDSVLGLLSVGSARPRALTNDHFRRAKSLAIPAAVAIQNARLYEWAEIYAAERQGLLEQAALTRKMGNNRASSS